MGEDKKHMKKVRKKRVKSVGKQIDEHEDKIKHEKGRKDTTQNYWKKEIEEKFSPQIEGDEKYLKEN